jgi:hypothetical protein
LRADPESAARIFESHYEAGIAPDITKIVRGAFSANSDTKHHESVPWRVVPA